MRLVFGVDARRAKGRETVHTSVVSVLAPLVRYQVSRAYFRGGPETVRPVIGSSVTDPGKEKLYDKARGGTGENPRSGFLAPNKNYFCVLWV